MNLKNKKIKEFSELLDENSYYKCKCVICNNIDFEQLANVDRYGFYYKPGICKTCGNVQQVEYYKPEILSNFYVNYYSHIYRDSLTVLQTFERQKQKGSEILSFCEMVLPKKGSVLDIGCSCGGVLTTFKKYGHDTVGCDYDTKYIDFGRKKGLELYNGGIESIPTDKSFDLIILRHVLEHIPNPVLFISQIIPFLKDGGFIYIEVPAIENVVDGGYDFNFSEYFQNAHFIHFNIYSIKNFASLCGLRIIKSNRYIKSLCTIGPTLKQNELKFFNGYQYSRQQIQLGNQRRNSIYRYYLDFKKILVKIIKRFIANPRLLFNKMKSLFYPIN